mmetsp:Transcript_29921/g.60326  ORF Transcript_29921/g.60326 Transcript_29921/m.60326 type:complete len:266 (+) Transcript_29921:66-863(+)
MRIVSSCHPFMLLRQDNSALHANARGQKPLCCPSCCWIAVSSSCCNCRASASSSSIWDLRCPCLSAGAAGGPDPSACPEPLNAVKWPLPTPREAAGCWCPCCWELPPKGFNADNRDHADCSAPSADFWLGAADDGPPPSRCPTPPKLPLPLCRAAAAPPVSGSSAPALPRRPPPQLVVPLGRPLVLLLLDLQASQSWSEFASTASQMPSLAAAPAFEPTTAPPMAPAIDPNTVPTPGSMAVPKAAPAMEPPAEVPKEPATLPTVL